jgi:hypothetical protein
MLNERLIPGTDNGINGGDLKRVNFCMKPTVIETVKEEICVGGNLEQSKEIDDGEEASESGNIDSAVEPIDAQLHRLMADANEQWTKLMENANRWHQKRKEYRQPKTICPVWIHLQSSTWMHSSEE